MQRAAAPLPGAAVAVAALLLLLRCCCPAQPVLPCTHLAGLLVALIALALQDGKHHHLNGSQHLGVNGVGLQAARQHKGKQQRNKDAQNKAGGLVGVRDVGPHPAATLLPCTDYACLMLLLSDQQPPSLLNGARVFCWAQGHITTLLLHSGKPG